jgi:flagellar hook-associated protein 3 FlgL
MSRITQGMLARSSLANLQHSLSRTERLQERLSTGRSLNRPSDSPTGLVTAMQTRSALARTRTHLTSADNAQGWLDAADAALQSASTMTGRARELVLLGNNAAMGPGSRDALAQEIEAIRDGLVDVANSTFAGRPVFAGTADSPTAFAPDGTYLGDAGAVSRTVGDGVTLDVNVVGSDVFGDGPGSIFQLLTDIAADLRTPGASVTANLGALDAARDQILSALGDVGARSNRLEGVRDRAVSLELNLTQRLSEVESVDLPETIMELQLQEVAYQAALSATSRVIQPSLLDFLR